MTAAPPAPGSSAAAPPTGAQPTAGSKPSPGPQSGAPGKGDGVNDWALFQAVGLPCRVIALTRHGEVHGYLIGTGSAKGKLAWATPSGRVRHCPVHPSELQLPSTDRPWTGHEMPGLAKAPRRA